MSTPNLNAKLIHHLIEERARNIALRRYLGPIGYSVHDNDTHQARREIEQALVNMRPMRETHEPV